MGDSVKQKRADEFCSNFARAMKLIMKRIEDLKSTPVSVGDVQPSPGNVEDPTPAPGNVGDLTSKLTLISNDIQEMRSSLHEATLFLPSYTIKVRQDEVRVLEKALTAKEEEVNPKKSFGFKTKFVRGNPPAAESKDVAAVKKDVPTTFSANANYLTIENIADKVLTYEDSELNKNDVLVRNLRNAVVHLNGSPSSLRLSNLTNCRLICGPVYTSAFIEDCKDCIVFLCCQQLRTHSSEGLDIYLRVRSRAIIEDCTKIRFAPYVWTHSKSSELHRLTEMDENLERFNCVDDFNWLASNSPSPNWSILPDAERITL